MPGQDGTGGSKSWECGACTCTNQYPSKQLRMYIIYIYVYSYSRFYTYLYMDVYVYRSGSHCQIHADGCIYIIIIIPNIP